MTLVIFVIASVMIVPMVKAQDARMDSIRSVVRAEFDTKLADLQAEYRLADTLYQNALKHSAETMRLAQDGLDIAELVYGRGWINKAKLKESKELYNEARAFSEQMLEEAEARVNTAAKNLSEHNWPDYWRKARLKYSRQN